MNKKFISMVMVIVMLATMLLPIGTAFAAIAPTVVAKTTGTSGTTTMNTTNSYKIGTSQTIVLSASHNSGIYAIEYGFDDDATQFSYTSSKTVTIPSTYKDGNLHYLDVRAQATDGTYSNWYTYKFAVGSNNNSYSGVEPTLKVTTAGTSGTTTMNTSNTYTIGTSQTINVSATHNSGIYKISYGFDNASTQYAYSSNKTISIPSTYKDGNVHYLDIQVEATDGSVSNWYTYKFMVSSNNNYYNDNYYDDNYYYSGIEPTLRVTTTGSSGTKNLNTSNTYLIGTSQTINVSATHNSGIYKISYGFDNASTQYVYSSNKTISIPSKYKDGNLHYLDVQVEAKDGSTSEWFSYKFMVSSSDSYYYDDDHYYYYDDDYYYGEQPTLTLSTNRTTMNTSKVYELDVYQTLSLKASHYSGIRLIEYGFDNEPSQFIYSPNEQIVIPSEYQDGNVHYLDIRVEASNGTSSDWFTYKFKYITDSNRPELEVTTQGKTSVTVMNTIDKYIVAENQQVTITGTHSSGIKLIEYGFDNDASTTTYGSSKTISIPAKYNDGYIHYLDVRLESNDGTSSGWYTYVFMIKDGSTTTYPFIILNDEKFNTNLNALSIALRNVPVTTKTGNKNFYSINENVQYNIDYVNGGAEITGDVYIDFVIPAGYTVNFIDKKGGTVIDSNTLRWTFNGLKAGEKGTIPVILTYTGIPSNGSIVKPYATIKSGSLTDSSAVANLIFNANTTISTRHEPFMIGDAGTNTFRPNEGLNRAEMAIILVRIFDIPLVTNAAVTYSDANVIAQNEYRWATDAIMTVTQYGLMQGYEDGSFRPGDKVTKAQLLTILARKFAIDGGSSTTTNAFAVKENPIKWFNNLSSVYASYGYDSHWAAQYLAQMIRLNMLPDFANTIDGNLDLIISRSDTAKLISTVLFRGPSVDGANGALTTTFVDVNAYTQNYEYILEASAPMHNSRFTSSGTEVMVK